MQISVSSTLTVFHDGRFWVGIVEHVEEGEYGIARIVFGAEPSDEEILQFVVERWGRLSFFRDGEPDRPDRLHLAKNPKRRQREASRALKDPAVGTKAQQALARQHEAGKQEAAKRRKRKRDEEGRLRYQLRAAKRKQRKRGH